MALFVHVAKAGSLSEAAPRLGMSRSAVRKAVAKLEKAWGHVCSSAAPAISRPRPGPASTSSPSAWVRTPVGSGTPDTGWMTEDRHKLPRALCRFPVP